MELGRSIGLGHNQWAGGCSNDGRIGHWVKSNSSAKPLERGPTEHARRSMIAIFPAAQMHEKSVACLASAASSSSRFRRLLRCGLCSRSPSRDDLCLEEDLCDLRSLSRSLSPPPPPSPPLALPASSCASRMSYLWAAHREARGRKVSKAIRETADGTTQQHIHGERCMAHRVLHHFVGDNRFWVKCSQRSGHNIAG